MLSGYRKVPERRHGFGRWSSTQARESTQESVREQGHAGAHFALPLAARWLKTIEFDQTFLISLKESVTSGTHPHEVVQFETIAVGPSPVVQLQRARKKVGFTGRLKYSSFGQTRVFT